MKKLVFFGTFLALSGCCIGDCAKSYYRPPTYHITCYSGTRVVWEGEASDLRITYEGALALFKDEDGTNMTMTVPCVIEENRDRSKD